MRVLVTGASGFIGGRLVAALYALDGVTVRAASRVSRAWPRGVEGAVIPEGDDRALAAACRGADSVVSLAAMSERACAADPAAALRVNGDGARRLAAAATAEGVARLVRLSTVKVYGNNPTGRLTEDSMTRPTSHYAITHRVGEDYVMSQHPNAVVFRLANAFGPPADPGCDCWGTITNAMCLEAVRARTITIRSAGLAWRNFVPLTDVVDAIVTSIRDLPSSVYHLGAARSLTLLGMAECVARVCAGTMGFTPVITTSRADSDPADVPLDFSTDRLAAAGFRPRAVFDDEVASTLRAATHAPSGAEPRD